MIHPREDWEFIHSKYVCDRLRGIQHLLFAIAVILGGGLFFFIGFGFILFGK